jgi:hypothetical protein
MTQAQRALLIGACTGLAVTLIGEGGLFLAAGYPIPGWALLSPGLAFAVGAAFFIRTFLRVRRSA